MVNTDVFRGTKINAVFLCQFVLLSITMLNDNTLATFTDQLLARSLLWLVPRHSDQAGLIARVSIQALALI